ncbi:hypothetical protein, partial [uncultured Dialister sp.]|uniref:hypothetical protein n=1 Tax=uncultured Dialister sp. TaxID=278064 RepID=UPI00265F36DD
MPILYVIIFIPQKSVKNQILFSVFNLFMNQRNEISLFIFRRSQDRGGDGIKWGLAEESKKRMMCR